MKTSTITLLALSVATAGGLTWGFWPRENRKPLEQTPLAPAAAPVRPNAKPAIVAAAADEVPPAKSEKSEKSEKSDPPKKPAETEKVTVTVTDAEIEEALDKGAPGWRKFSGEQRDRMIRMGDGWVRAKKLAAAGQLKVSKPPRGRKVIVDIMNGVKPVGRPEDLTSFVSSKKSAGAYLAAAGASRDAAWLDKGLLQFPNDPGLLKAKALMYNSYAENPAMLEAWRQSHPESAWPNILEAEIALGKNDPKKAYELLAGALNKSLETGVVPEIGELMSSIFASNPPDYRWNFIDIGDDAGVIDRLAIQFRTAAKEGSTNGDPDWSYYGGATLALYDMQSDSPNTDEAKRAAQGALETLKMIGEENADQFLGGKTYEDAVQNYRNIVKTTGRQVAEARSHLASLPSAEAKANFERLWSTYGAMQAMQMARNGSK